MHKPSSFISSITLVAFLQAQIASVWALPAAIPEQKPAPTLLYLGDDPYTQALLKLQYDGTTNSLEWQLLNNGLVLTSQSHALPEATESVDSAVVFDGDQIVVAGRTRSQKWFIRALNSQGEFQWQRSGEGRVYDLAFSEDGQRVYAVGQSEHSPLLIALNAKSGSIQFHTEQDKDISGAKKPLIYKQLVVTGDNELVVAAHRDIDGQLDFIKWQTEVDVVTGNFHWRTSDAFCEKCKRTGVKAVALSNNKNPSYFLVVTSSGSGLSFEMKDFARGKTINHKTVFPKESYTRDWHSVLKVNAQQDLSEPLKIYEKTSGDSWLSNSQLLLASHECLIGAGFHNSESSLLVDLCQPSAFAPHRKLLQTTEVENNVTTTMPDTAQEDTLQRILTAIEVTASVFGIVGAITLCTGFASFMNSQWNKHKENINNALDKENQRRHKEEGVLQGLPGIKPFISFDPDGSVFNLEVQPPSIIVSDGQEHVESGQKIINTLVRHIRKADHTAVDAWLTANKEHLNKKDNEGYTVLHHLARMAVEGGDASAPKAAELLSIANQLLQQGASPDIPSEREQLSPLQLAAVHDDGELFELLLTRKLDVDFDELSALFHLAVRSGGAEVLQIMINRELHKHLRFIQQTNPLNDLWKINKVSIQTEEGYTLLHEAVLEKNVEALKLLLEKNIIPVDAVDSEGHTALHLAASEKNSLAVTELLTPRGVTRRHASVSAKDRAGNHPLHRAAQVAENGEIIRSLLGEHASLTAKNKSHRTPLDLACERGLHGNIKVLLTGDHAKPELHPAMLHFMARNGYGDAIYQMGAERLRKHLHSLDKDENQPLQVSIKHNHLEAAAALISVGASVTIIKPTESYTHDLLFLAASKNNIKLLQKLIDDGWNLEQENLLGQTIMHISAMNGFIEVVRLLQSSGASIIKPDHSGNTPLHLAAMNGNSHMVKLLIAFGADVNALNQAGNSPAHLAVVHSGLSLLDILIENGANICKPNKEGGSVIQLALNKNRPITISILARSHKTIDDPDENGDTAVHFAVQNNRQRDLDVLVESGANLSVRNQNGQEPIHLAASHGNTEMIIFLTNHGVDINSLDNNGSSAIHLASMNGMPAALRLLISLGAQINQPNFDNNTPAHLAAMYSGLGLLEILIANGAFLSIPNDEGHSVICLGLLKNRFVTRTTLHTCGKSIDEADINGNTAVHLAALSNNSKLLEALVESGANLNLTNKFGDTALHIAIKKGHVEASWVLLENNADINVKGSEGYSARRLVIREQNQRIIELFASLNIDLKQEVDSHASPLLQ